MGRRRIYICHTFYHVYISFLKEFAGNREGNADIVLSTMSTDFGDLEARLSKSGVFDNVFKYEEQWGNELLARYKVDRGNGLLNMLERIIYTKKLGRLQERFVPTDLSMYDDIYVFCDSDPIGYYLNYKRIKYHAVEDGLDCIKYYDTARYDNRGNFNLKVLFSKLNLIFIQNGYGKYCIDMEINDISAVPYPCKKYVELPRKQLTSRLTSFEKEIIVNAFISNIKELKDIVFSNEKSVLILTEPLCDLDTRKRIFSDIINDYAKKIGNDVAILIKPHPRDELDYNVQFPEYIVLSAKFPMEVLNYIEGLVFEKIYSVLTVPSGLTCAKEVVFLGDDFLDIYEAPEKHRQNDYI